MFWPLLHLAFLRELPKNLLFGPLTTVPTLLTVSCKIWAPPLNAFLHEWNGLPSALMRNSHPSFKIKLTCYLPGLNFWVLRFCCNLQRDQAHTCDLTIHTTAFTACEFFQVQDCVLHWVVPSRHSALFTVWGLILVKLPVGWISGNLAMEPCLELPLPLQNCKAISVLRGGSSVLELNLNVLQWLWPRKGQAGLHAVVQSTRAHVIFACVPWRKRGTPLSFSGFIFSPHLPSFPHPRGAVDGRLVSLFSLCFWGHCWDQNNLQ